MARHPETDLVPYLRGELPPAERERVARHLEECPDCKQDTELLRDLIGNLAHFVGQPPEVNWARYRAELREKLEARRARIAWWRQPTPLALSASIAGVLLFLAVWGGRELTKTPDTIGPLHRTILSKHARHSCATFAQRDAQGRPRRSGWRALR